MVKAFVVTTACVDTDPEKEPLQVLKHKHAYESHADDDEDQHHVEQHEHERVLLFG